jgi:hypothetical protein
LSISAICQGASLTKAKLPQLGHRDQKLDVGSLAGRLTRQATHDVCPSNSRLCRRNLRRGPDQRRCRPGTCIGQHMVNAS